MIFFTKIEQTLKYIVSQHLNVFVIFFLRDYGRI